MNKLIFSAQILLCVLLSNVLQGQGTAIPFAESFTERYSECAAITFNDKVLVENYSLDAICSISDTFSGVIRLSTVRLSSTRTEIKKDIPFRWAIKNNKTGTIYSVDGGPKTKIQLDDILKHCGMDDTIIIMTVDPYYSLPHNEKLIRRKC